MAENVSAKCQSALMVKTQKILREGFSRRLKKVLIRVAVFVAGRYPRKLFSLNWSTGGRAVFQYDQIIP